jgi:hypothetical protein
LNSVVDKPVDESDGALRNSARWPCVEGKPEVAAATVHQLAGYGWVQPIFSRGGSAGGGRTARFAQRRPIPERDASPAAAATAAAVIAATGGPGAGGGAMQARTTAYVVSRVEKALASQHLVLRGRTTGGGWGPSTSWSYGPRHRFEEFTGSGCGHALPDGSCTHRGESEPYLAQGTALVGVKLTSVYVTYFNRKWSVISEFIAPNACSSTGTLEMGGPPPATSNWPAFIKATLACGAATVTGHALIGGVDTLKITGSPVTIKLPQDQAKAYRETWLRERWTLYVNPKTYLPVRLSSSSEMFGGPAPSTHSASVTDMQWLQPTAANIAQALVTIPARFRQASSPADQ